MKEDILRVNMKNSGIFNISLCGISYCDGSYEIQRNNSNTYCFEYIISGTGTVKTKGETYYPQKNDVYMLFEGENHHYYSDGKNPWTKIWFNITGSLIGHLITAYGLEKTTLVKDINLCNDFEEFINICKSGDDSIGEKASLQFHKILQKLSNKVHEKDLVTDDEAKKIKLYIDSNIEKNFSIDELSNMIFRSKSQTIRIFKNAYKRTPYDYIVSQKIGVAKILLSDTNLMIKEIAFRLNFADEHYFSNVFKEKVGMTPKKWRNR